MANPEIATFAFSTIAVPLGIALALSLTVERILEFFKRILTASVSLQDVSNLSDIKNIYEKYLELARLKQLEKKCSESDQAAQQAAEKLISTPADAGAREKLLEELGRYSADSEIDEQLPSTAITAADATAPSSDRIQREFILQSLGFALGIVLARTAELQLFSSFGIGHFEPWQDYLLTGLLIGGGSSPIHVLLRFISERKIPAKPDEVDRDETETTHNVPDSASIPNSVNISLLTSNLNKLKEIAYNGGVDRDKLQHVHIRRQNPDLIIYHHTTMNRSSRFEDVVNVIKNRKDSQGNPWLTGYNCVVTGDGGIHPFCRWDRYGNHAAGLNARSLGLAFNGNFEIDPSVPFSNPDGRYGPSVPSDEQLDAGARVVALWCHLYRIAVDFNNKIIPHAKVSAKSCPGGNFPHEQFKKLVHYYYEAWMNDPDAVNHMEIFRTKPYLMVA